MSYRVAFRQLAVEMLLAVSSRKDQQTITRRIDELADNPEALGKPLTKELAGFWSCRAVGQRYRIIYRIEEATQTLWILAMGLRREGDTDDIYEVAKRLHEKQHLDEPKPGK